MMFVWYTYTDEGRLKNLFWPDGLSHVDYYYFGNVLAFDTTYKKKKNKYGMSLAIFSGTNHHQQTCIFACALMSNEWADTYKWVLEMFFVAMQKKKPSVVVKDYDRAMKKAIKVVFLYTTHQLCA